MTWLALLRGVNVGGKRVAMADLRAMASEMGFDRPRTLLQSGNLVFEGRNVPAASLERRLQAGLRDAIGVESEIFVRTAAEWRDVLAANPFPEEAKRDPSHLLVMCLRTTPTPKQVRAAREAIVGRERIAVVGRQAYLLYPDGIGRSKLTGAIVERALGSPGTMRNWNTATKVAVLADS
jgi:uncharacterized protein (DUF1697 family)